MKKQSKTAQIRKLLEQGKTVAEIAKKLKVTPAAAYQVRWRMHNAKMSKPVDREIEIKEAVKKEPVDIHTLAPVPVAPVDLVNEPPHYKAGKIETIDYIEAWNFSYHLANVIKYVSRAPYKGNYLQDLKKAEWYLKRAIRNFEESVQ